MILGIGIDIVDISRISSSIEKYKQRFIARIFTEDEIDYCNSKANKNQHYAVRFAGKEAFFKALGSGVRDGITWHDVEFSNDKLGKPILHHRGKASEIMKSLGAQRAHVSFTHSNTSAAAVIVIENE